MCFFVHIIMKFCKNINWVQLLIFLFCLLGFIYHIKSICDVYFTYSTVITVETKRLDFVELPAITLCVWLHNAFNTTKIASTSPWKEIIRENYNNKTENLNQIYHQLLT